MTAAEGVVWCVRVLRNVYEPFEIPGAGMSTETVQRLALVPGVFKIEAVKAERLLMSGDAVPASEEEYLDYMAPLVEKLRETLTQVREKIACGDLDWLRANRDVATFFLDAGNIADEEAERLRTMLREID